MNIIRFYTVPYRVNRREFPKSPKHQAPKWLMRFIDRLYHYLGDFQPIGVSIEYETTVIDFTSIIDGLHQHIHEVRRTTALDPKYLIIGREEYYKLSGQIMKDYPYSFGPYPHDQLDILGLQVVIVPWIDGLFCLPDLGRL